MLLEWSNRYDHLREVTRDDVLGHLSTVHGSQRKHTLVALRSLFTRAKKNGTIFKNPTSRIRVGQQEHGVIQPLDPGHVQSSVAVVVRPLDELTLQLALAWLDYRRRRWPDTANLHLLINKQTALETGPISGVSVSAARPPHWNGSVSTASSKKPSSTAPTHSTLPRSSAWTRRPRSATRTRHAHCWHRQLSTQQPAQQKNLARLVEP
ncbi:hypothetical protein ACIQOU_29280 [Streptomyces sp. NPDC091279]|uniref:hypothetical protein n=1 Tax=Streptomyces sp. NPDC091279 TaxID=3365983 RepID=UPI0038134E98